MKKKMCAIVVMSVWIVVIGIYATAVKANTDIPRITVENLKKWLDDPKSDVTILDVRTGSSWTESEVMIKSAVREDPDDFAAWAKKHPKENTIVLYCT